MVILSITVISDDCNVPIAQETVDNRFGKRLIPDAYGGHSATFDWLASKTLAVEVGTLSQRQAFPTERREEVYHTPEK